MRLSLPVLLAFAACLREWVVANSRYPDWVRVEGSNAFECGENVVENLSVLDPNVETEVNLFSAHFNNLGSYSNNMECIYTFLVDLIAARVIFSVQTPDIHDCSDGDYLNISGTLTCGVHYSEACPNCPAEYTNIRAGDVWIFHSNSHSTMEGYFFTLAPQVNECLDDNGGCQHICIDEPYTSLSPLYPLVSRSCSCNAGYALNSDGTSCSPYTCVLPTENPYGYDVAGMSCASTAGGLTTGTVDCSNGQPACISFTNDTDGLVYSFPGTPTNADHVCLGEGEPLTVGGCDLSAVPDCVTPGLGPWVLPPNERSVHFVPGWFDVDVQCEYPHQLLKSKQTFSLKPLTATLTREGFQNPRRVSGFSVGGHPYVLIGSGGLFQGESLTAADCSIVDVGDPSAMSIIWSAACHELVEASGLDLPLGYGLTRDVIGVPFEISGRTYLLLTSSIASSPDGEELAIADVSDPSNPVVVSVAKMDGLREAWNGMSYVQNSRTYAVLVGKLDAARDISDGSDPNAYGWVSIFDVTNPLVPVRVAMHRVEGIEPSDAQVFEQDEKLFMIVSLFKPLSPNNPVWRDAPNSGYQILDITDLNYITSIAAFQSHDELYLRGPNQMCVYETLDGENMAAFSLKFDGLAIVNLTDLTTAKIVGVAQDTGEDANGETYRFLGTPYGITCIRDGSRTVAALLAQLDSTVNLIDITDPRSLMLESVMTNLAPDENGYTAKFLDGSTSIDSFMSGIGSGFVVVSSFVNRGLTLLDFSAVIGGTASKPVVHEMFALLPFYTYLNRGLVVELGGKPHAFVVGDGLHVFDLSDPIAPLKLATISAGAEGTSLLGEEEAHGIAHHVDEFGATLLFVSVVKSGRVLAFDVTNPNDISPLWEILIRDLYWIHRPCDLHVFTARGRPVLLVMDRIASSRIAEVVQGELLFLMLDEIDTQPELGRIAHSEQTGGVSFDHLLEARAAVTLHHGTQDSSILFVCSQAFVQVINVTEIHSFSRRDSIIDQGPVPIRSLQVVPDGTLTDSEGGEVTYECQDMISSKHPNEQGDLVVSLSMSSPPHQVNTLAFIWFSPEAEVPEVVFVANHETYGFEDLAAGIGRSLTLFEQAGRSYVALSMDGVAGLILYDYTELPKVIPAGISSIGTTDGAVATAGFVGAFKTSDGVEHAVRFGSQADNTGVLHVIRLRDTAHAEKCAYAGDPYTVVGCDGRHCIVGDESTMTGNNPTIVLDDKCSPGNTLLWGDTCLLTCEDGYELTSETVQPFCYRGQFDSGNVGCDITHCGASSLQLSEDESNVYYVPNSQGADAIEVGEVECTAGYGAVSETNLPRVYCREYGEMLIDGCVSCPEGKFTDGTTKEPCRPCPIGRFNDVSSSSSCIRCPAPTSTSSEGMSECDICLAGSIKSLDGECEECNVEGLDCSSDGITQEHMILKVGYWRKYNTSNMSWVFDCPYTAACMGGNTTGNASCIEGFEGPVCGICSGNFYMIESTAQCVSCDDQTRQAFAVALVLVSIFIALYTLRKQHKMSTQEANDTSRSASQFQLESALVPKLKIVIPLLQVLSNLEWVYGVENLFKHEIFDSIRELLSYFSFDIFSAIPLSCIGIKRTALVSLQTVTLPPIVMLVVIVLVTQGGKFCCASMSPSMRSFLLSGVVLYWNIILPTTSVKIFRFLRPCVEHEDGGTFMRDDYGTECSSPEYATTKAYLWTMFVVYPVSVPAVTLIVLVLQRRNIKVYLRGKRQLRNICLVLKEANMELHRDKPNELVRSKLVSDAQAIMIKSLRQGGAAEGFKPSDATALAYEHSAHGYKLRTMLKVQIETLKELHVYVDNRMYGLLGISEKGPSVGMAMNKSSAVLRIAYELFAYYTKWWWEVFETLRKLVVLGLVIVITEDTTRRLVISFFVEALSLYMYTHFHPYRDAADNLLAEGARGLTLITFLYALGVRLELIYDYESEIFTFTVALGMLLIICTALYKAKVLDIVSYFLSPRFRKMIAGGKSSNDEFRVMLAPSEIDEPPWIVRAIREGGDVYLDELLAGAIPYDSELFPVKTSSLFDPITDTSSSVEHDAKHRDSFIKRLLANGSDVSLAPVSSLVTGRSDAYGEPNKRKGGDAEGTDGKRDATSAELMDDNGSRSHAMAAADADEVLRPIVEWAITAAVRSHFFPATHHNLRVLMANPSFVKNLPDLLYGDMRRMLHVEMDRIGQPVSDQVVGEDHQSIVGSAVLNADGGLMRDPPLKMTIEEADGSSRVAQDNAGALSLPDWDWDAADNEKIWIHVLILVAIAINDTFHEQLDMTLRREEVLGNAFDGFSPAQPKSYGRMNAKMNSPEDHLHRARPRPSMNVDIVRCLIQVPTVHDVKRTLYAIKERFGGFVKFKNAYDMPEDVASEEYFHLRLILGSVLFQPTLHQFLSTTQPHEPLPDAADRPLEFSDISASMAVQTQWAAYAGQPAHLDGEPNARRRAHVRRALNYLRSDAMAGEVVGMICEAQMVTRFVGEVRNQMHECYKIYRAPDRERLFMDFNKKQPLAPATLVEAARQGEYDLVPEMAQASSDEDVEDALAVALRSGFPEVIEQLRKTRPSVDPAVLPADASWERYERRREDHRRQAEEISNRNAAAAGDNGTSASGKTRNTQSSMYKLESMQAKFREVRVAMADMPPKERRSAAQHLEYANLKKKAHKLQSMINAASAGNSDDKDAAGTAPEASVVDVKAEISRASDNSTFLSHEGKSPASTEEHGKTEQIGREVGGVDTIEPARVGSVVTGLNDRNQVQNTPTSKKELVAEFNHLREAMSRFPPKDARSDEENAEYVAIKKRALEVQRIVKASKTGTKNGLRDAAETGNTAMTAKGGAPVKNELMDAGHPPVSAEVNSTDTTQVHTSKRDNPSRAALTAKLHKIREAMDGFPAKEDRTAEQEAAYKK